MTYCDIVEGWVRSQVSKNIPCVKAMTEPWATSKEGLRASAGLGVVLRLGSMGRAELNYCFPVKALSGDMVQHGLQVGIGVDFA